MSDDYLDLTLMQKRGLLKIRKEESERELLDLTKPRTSSVPAVASEPTPSFDFLKSMAGIGETVATPTPSLGSENSDLSSLKIKIEDTEYKLERLIERLERIEEKLSNLENKAN